jgi:hypothetical protein
MLQQCCNIVATLLQHFKTRYSFLLTNATMLQQCCNNVATLLQHCCNIVATF